MSLATAKYVSAATESGHGALHDPDWNSWLPISRGLRMVVLGYRVLVAGAILSPPLLWLGIHEGPWSEWLEQHKRHPHALLFLGLIVLALTALFSHGWLLRGYALCLNYAPRHRGAGAHAHLRGAQPLLEPEAGRRRGARPRPPRRGCTAPCRRRPSPRIAGSHTCSRCTAGSRTPSGSRTDGLAASCVR